MPQSTFGMWLALITFALFAPRAAQGQDGTQQNLEGVIKGRCYEFKYFTAVDKHKNFSVDISCNDVWTKFKESFANKDPCLLNNTSYDALFNMLKRKSSDKLLFWHETNELSHDVSSVTKFDYVTLEDTFTGYISDKLTWCGCVIGTPNCSADGINYNSCPTNCSFGSFITTPWWMQASTEFAKTAKDIAYVMLNGTMTAPAYEKNSFFGRDELPAIGGNGQVKKLVAFVAVNPTMKVREKCGEGSLLTLVEDSKKYGIAEVECEDNPTVVFGVLCAKYPDSQECNSWKKASSGKLKNEEEEITGGMIALIVLIVIFALLSLILMFFLYRYHRKNAGKDKARQVTGRDNPNLE